MQEYDKRTLTANRLRMERISPADHLFIFELVNTPDWIRFIGDKKIKSPEDAKTFIEKITGSENTTYWVVKLKDGGDPIGVITFIKRDYLPHHDIGFAFLPAFVGKGYAFEATHAILRYLASHKLFTTILAFTLPHNAQSIRLLQKLGLQYEMEIEKDGSALHIYKATADNLSDTATKQKDL